MFKYEKIVALNKSSIDIKEVVRVETNLSKVAYVTLYYVRIPIIPSASFLRLDVKDVFIVMIGLLYGPVYAFVGAVCVSVLQMLSVSEYGFIGLAMNVLSVSSFTMPVSIIYKKKQNNIGLISA